MKLRSLSISLLAASCTFGGSDEDPTMGLRPSDAGPSVDAPTLDAAARVDAAPIDAKVSAKDSALPTDAAPTLLCTPATAVDVCDPVHNTGCDPFTQCEIDPTASTASGRCVYWNVQLGDQCSSDGLATTCEGPASCVDGSCRTPCYCDEDCGAGSCCRAAAPGPAGPVMLCEPC